MKTQKDTALVGGTRIEWAPLSTGGIPFIHRGVVPHGNYTARVIDAVESKTNAGNAALDIVYEFTDASGKVVTARERLNVASKHFAERCRVFLDAGVPNGAPAKAIIGVSGAVVVSYSDTSQLGQLTFSRPLAYSPVSAAAPPIPPSVSNSGSTDIADDGEDDTDDDSFEDDEYDDFLEDEDYED